MHSSHVLSHSSSRRCSIPPTAPTHGSVLSSGDVAPLPVAPRRSAAPSKASIALDRVAPPDPHPVPERSPGTSKRSAALPQQPQKQKTRRVRRARSTPDSIDAPRARLRLTSIPTSWARALRSMLSLFVRRITGSTFSGILMWLLFFVCLSGCRPQTPGNPKPLLSRITHPRSFQAGA